jgi:hypothetical protein
MPHPTETKNHYELDIDRNVLFYSTHLRTNALVMTRNWWSPLFIKKLFSLNKAKSMATDQPIYFLGTPFMYLVCDAFLERQGTFEALGEMNNLIFNISLLSPSSVLSDKRMKSKLEGEVKYIFGTRYSRIARNVTRAVALYITKGSKPIKNICMRSFDQIKNPKWQQSLSETFLYEHILPNIRTPINLWVGGSDAPISYDPLIKLINSDKVSRIFLENSPTVHSKIQAVPIGLSGHSLQQPFFDALKTSELLSWKDRNVDVLIGGFANKSYGDRAEVYKYAESNCSLCFVPSSMLELITPRKYWNRVIKSKFVMSPHGGGWDCHRCTLLSHEYIFLNDIILYLCRSGWSVLVWR